MYKKLEDFFSKLFLLSIFLFKIPNFYILPFFKNPFFTTQGLARLLIGLVFVFKLKEAFTKKRIIFQNRNKKLFFLIILFFIFQSLSIFSAINIIAFWSRYKDVIISLIVFFIGYFYKNHLKKIIIVFLFSVFLNFIYKFILFFDSIFFREFLSNFIYEKHINFVVANLSRDRIYTDTYDEIVIPFLFLSLFKNFLLKTTLIFIVFFSLISNFRSYILMSFLAISLSIKFLIKKFLISKIFYKIFFYFSFLFLFIFIILEIMSFFNKTSFLDRLNIRNPENINTISSRIFQIQLSFEMANKNIFGIGLGNYYDNIPNSIKNKDLILSDSEMFIKLGAEEYVHNIFGFIVSESGYLSLFIFICIIYFFIKDDVSRFKSRNKYIKAFIISFWVLFIYGLFNPIVPASYQVLFWLMRGLLI